MADTGPLVALFNRRDEHHEWSVERFKELRPPLSTCEATIAEAYHLLASVDQGRRRLMELVLRGILKVDFSFHRERDAVARLLAKYADVPMDFADACIVRRSELAPKSRVWTVDADFRVYRRNGRQVIPLLAPW